MQRICFLSATRIGRERAAETLADHSLIALCGLVLDYIPCSTRRIFDANDVRRNPVHREAEVRKSSSADDESPSPTIVPCSYLRVGRQDS